MSSPEIIEQNANKRTRLIAGTSAAAIGLAAIGYFGIVREENFDIRDQSITLEAALMTEMIGEGSNLRIIENELLILHEGINVRETPQVINEPGFPESLQPHPQAGNLAYTIAGGQAEIIREPVYLTLDDGTRWYGFTPSGNNQSEFSIDDLLWVADSDGTKDSIERLTIEPSESTITEVEFTFTDGALTRTDTDRIVASAGGVRDIDSVNVTIESTIGLQR